MVSCASCGCSYTTNNKSLGVTFHSFPKNEKQKEKWIAFLRNPEFTFKKSSVLCCRHFEENCFDRTSRVKVRLFLNALPTIQVDRLKYVRTYNQMIVSSVIDVKNEPQSPDVQLSNSAEQEFSPPLPNKASSDLEETPHERNLKRRIHVLQRRDCLKTLQIRRLQKIIIRQKKRISSLKAVVKEIRTEHQNVSTAFYNYLDRTS